MFDVVVEVVVSRQSDAERRITFISSLITELENSPINLNYILWTDESKFTNNGIINEQNNCYWDNQNPHWIIKTNNQCVWRTNVWCGLIRGKLSGPYFYNGTLNGRRYFEFLMKELPIMLDDIPFATRNNLILYQDGYPAHNATRPGSRGR
jgi:hypothetical protein